MKVLNLGFCPRCKEDLEGMMTRAVDGVLFCWLCSHDVDENPIQKSQCVKWARDYAEERGIEPEEVSE